MLRKLTLTGFLLLLPQSLSLVRLVAALVISVGHVLVLTIARPFRDSDHSTFLLALVASVGMCGVLLAALLIKLFNAIDDAGAILPLQSWNLHAHMPRRQHIYNIAHLVGWRH